VKKIDFPKIEFFKKNFIQRRSSFRVGSENTKNHVRNPKNIEVCLVNMRKNT